MSSSTPKIDTVLYTTLDIKPILRSLLYNSTPETLDNFAQTHRRFYLDAKLVLQEKVEIENPRDLRRKEGWFSLFRREKVLEDGSLDYNDVEVLKGSVRYLTLGGDSSSWHQATSFGNRFDGPSLVNLLYSLKNLEELAICRTNFPLSQLFNVLSALPGLKRLQLTRVQERTDVFPSYNHPEPTSTSTCLDSVHFSELYKHVLQCSSSREVSLRLMTTATMKNLRFDWVSFYQLFRELRLKNGSQNVAFPGLFLERFEIRNRWRNLEPEDEEVPRIGQYITLFLEKTASELRELKLQVTFDLPVPKEFEALRFTNLRKFSGPGTLLNRLSVGHRLAEVELLDGNSPAKEFSRMQWSTSLRVLRMFWREADEELYSTIADACPGLSHLFLNTLGSDLHAASFTRLAGVVAKFRHLEILELSGTLPFDVPAWTFELEQVVPAAFSAHPNLRVLHLQRDAKWVRGSSGKWGRYKALEQNSTVVHARDVSNACIVVDGQVISV